MATTKEQIAAYDHDQRRSTRRRMHEDDAIFLQRLKRKYGRPPIRTLSKAHRKDLIEVLTPAMAEKARRNAMRKQR